MTPFDAALSNSVTAWISIFTAPSLLPDEIDVSSFLRVVLTLFSTLRLRRFRFTDCRDRLIADKFFFGPAFAGKSILLKKNIKNYHKKDNKINRGNAGMAAPAYGKSVLSFYQCKHCF
jgi:hypothetical protein